MTTARSQLVDADGPGYYHCVSRCVRRAWLCGLDQFTGQSFEHRRGWIEDRLLELADIFAISLYAYAVMSNHVHVVLRMDPLATLEWSDTEIAARWVRLFPATDGGVIDPDARQRKEQALLGNAQRLQQCRQRLGSLSWFMRCLNEPIARRANREDACTGRFWEGRYRCQALLDEAALLACMSYVDLNPIRAGDADDALRPVRSGVHGVPLSIRADAYLELIDWTARRVRPGRRGVIPENMPLVLNQLGLRERHWQFQVLGIESRYFRAWAAPKR